MRPYLITFACLCSAIAFVSAVPVPASNQELDVLQIPLSDGKELDVLTLGSKDQEQLIAERNKRTIGLLRELFPDITKQIDGIVNRIIAQVIRVAGPDVLRSVLGNNRNVTPRPNLAADFDDDDDDDDDNDDDNTNSLNKLDNNSKTTTTTSSSLSNGDNTRVQIDLPTFPPETAQATNKVSSTSSLSNSNPSNPTTTTTTTSSTTPSTTTSTTTTTTTTTSSPIYIISPIKTAVSTPSTTTTSSTTSTTTTTTLSPTTTTSTTNNDPNAFNPVSDITLNIPNALTSSMVNSLTNSLQNEIQTNPQIRTVNETQLMAIVESLNRLLNSTNYFVATRDNFSSPTTIVPSTQTTTSIIADSTVSTTTPKITKLLPVNN